ncbi:MAG: 6-bladed beta-propeller [Gracilimonas sp.]
MPNFHKATGIFFLLLFSSFGCNNQIENDGKDIKISEVQIDTLYTFADFETHDIAQPSDIKMMSNGTLAIADFGQKKVSLLKQNGEIISSFGREGRGPGEFIRIQDLIEIDHILNVVDSDQSMLSRFDLEGNFINSYAFKSQGLLNQLALIQDSVYVVGTAGTDGALLAITDLRNDSTLKFGEPKGKSLEAVDLQASLNQLRNGKIPELFKNMVTLRANDSHIFAFLNSYSELNKYDISGNLIWNQQIDLPHNEEIFDSVVERAKNSPSGLPALDYISNFKIFDKEVFILTQRSSSDVSQLLVKLTDDGKIATIYSLPDYLGYLASFDLDLNNNIAYFTSSQDGVVYKGEIPF